jgi:outer membrane protein
MKSKFLRPVLAIAVISMISAWAQTSSAAPARAASSPASPATSTTMVTGEGSKIGTINIEQAVIGSNEGQRDFEVLKKKVEPKQNELKSQNDELEALQKQYQTQVDKLNDDAKATLMKEIETKKKSFDRAVQDAQEDYQNQSKDVFQKILQKMAPSIIKYAQDNGFAMIVDTSNPWPQSPILWYDGNKYDITKAVVDVYNVQSGVPAPAAAAAPKPAATKPAPKPAAPATTPPQK